jgi:hypothetical protein
MARKHPRSSERFNKQKEIREKREFDRLMHRKAKAIIVRQAGYYTKKDHAHKVTALKNRLMTEFIDKGGDLEEL